MSVRYLRLANQSAGQRESRGLVNHAHRRLLNAVWHVPSEPVERLELSRAPVVSTALRIDTYADLELLRLVRGPRELGAPEHYAI